MDAPQTPGDWNYSATSGNSVARFGQPGSNPKFALRCNFSSQEIELIRAGRADSAVPMNVRTETQSRAMTITPNGSGGIALSATMPARDPLLDAIALSRGRFAIEVPGLDTLYIPAWPEITRVVEDCR